MTIFTPRTPEAILKITLSGPQGCGKSTVARLLSTIIPAGLAYEIVEKQDESSSAATISHPTLKEKK